METLKPGQILDMAKDGIVERRCDGCENFVRIEAVDGGIKVENTGCRLEPGYCLKTEVEIAARRMKVRLV